MEKNKNFDERLNIRLNDELMFKARQLLNDYPKTYENLSHVFRCALMRLYNNRYK